MHLSLLYELQGLHKEMGAIETRLEELRDDKKLRRLKEEYQRLKQEYLKVEEKLKKNSYQQEVRINEVRNLEYNKKASEEIKFSRETDTMKKLENIEKHIEILENKKRAAENDIIALINEADNINKELDETKKRLAFIKKKYLNSKESADKEIAELEARKSELAPKIDNLIKKIDNESYEIYSRLLKIHADPVARVENRICSGCKMEVPAMDYEALKSGNQELKCQNCGRLLYYCKP
jgi:predicted  nucleic acid-binding Zn-ribbon protein